jgi:hypothetical protein
MIPEATARTSGAIAAAHQPARPASALGRFFSVENRYLAPMFITCILLAGQFGFGFLESFSRTSLAITTSIVLELVLGRWTYGKFPNVASAYISGISVGILVRSPEYWPYVVTSGLSITSKYVLRWKGRHLWNPSNFAICAMLLLAPEYFATLSIQWGNTIWPMLAVWVLGALIVYRVRRFHITATYVVSFLILSAVRSAITGHPLLAEVAPITGPMYQLFIFFMITDPKTNVTPKWGQYLVAVLVAVVEMILRLAQVVNAPFFALTIVGPAALAIDIWWQSTHMKTAKSHV